MAPTICSDKKQQTQRGGGTSNLRRQTRGLQRNNAQTVSIINYVSKGVVNPHSISQLRQRTNSTTSNSSESSDVDLNDSAITNRRLQDQHYRQQQRQHQQFSERSKRQQYHEDNYQHSHPHQEHHQETEATLSSRPKNLEISVSSTLPSSSLPSSSSSLSSSMSRKENVAFVENETNAERNSQSSAVDSLVLSPPNTFNEDSLRSDREGDDESVQFIYDADMEDATTRDSNSIVDYDEHSIASDYSDVAIDLSGDDSEQRRQHSGHQKVFNTPALGDKQQHISVICRTNSNNNNRATNTINYNSKNNNTNNNNNNSTINNNNHKNIVSDFIKNARDTHYDLCEIKNTEGLLSIAIKTIKLVKRNQLLQRRLAQLQQETSEFIQSVMANPENCQYRENLDAKEQPPLKQQRTE